MSLATRETLSLITTNSHLKVAASSGQAAERLLAAVLPGPQHNRLDVLVAVHWHHVVNVEGLLVSVVEGGPHGPRSGVPEVPLSHREILQDAHPCRDLPLHPHHAATGATESYSYTAQYGPPAASSSLQPPAH